MSLTATVRRERAEAEKRADIEEALDSYGDMDPGDDGDVLTFSREVPSKAAEGETILLRYAFIRSGDLYFGTGSRTPQGVPWAVLVDFLVEHGVGPMDVDAYSAALTVADRLDEWL